MSAEPDDGFEPVEDDGFEPVDDGFEEVAEEPAAAPAEPNLHIRNAYNAAGNKAPEELAKQYATSKALGVPLRLVDADPGGWYDHRRKVELDENGWAKENPELAKAAADDPELAPTIVSSKDLGLWVKGWNKIADFFAPLERRPQGSDLAILESAEASGWPAWEKDEAGKAKLAQFRALTATGLTPDQAAAQMASEMDARLAQEKAARDAPQQVTELDDDKARAIREDPSLAARGVVLYARYQEGQASVDLSKASFQLMLARATGGDTAAIEESINSLEREATPRAFGEESVGQFLSTIATGAPSTIDVLKESSATAILGGLVGAGAGAAIGKTPAAAVKGFNAMLRASAMYGAGQQSFVLETGASYRELGETRTDKGEPLTEAERRGGAVVGGMLKAALEVMELRAIAKTFGPATKLLQVGGKDRMKALLSADPKFRKLVADAGAQVLKSYGEEGLEGGAQNVVEQVIDYMVSSAHDERLQAGPVVEGRQVLQAASDESAGGLGFGAAGSTVRVAVGLAGKAIHANKSAAAEKQPAQLLKLAEDPVAQAAPEVMAKVVAETSGKTGDPVTALHVQGEALKRYFQNHTPEEKRAEIVEALGEKGPDLVAEAEATGTLEVPVETVIATYGKSPMAAALLPDTASQPGYMTPAERAAGGAERAEQAAKEIAAKGIEQLAKDEEFGNGLKEIRKQLEARGHTKEVVNAEVAHVRHFYETLAKNKNVEPRELLAEYPIEFGIGDELPMNAPRPPSARPPRVTPADVAEQLAAYRAPLAPEAKVEDLYRDDVSGLRNKRALLEALPPNAPVSVLTTPDIKPINDDVAGGHDKANDLLRVIGSIIGAEDPGAARAGTSFIIPTADVAAVAEKVRAAMPPGIVITTAKGVGVDDAFTQLEAFEKAEREAKPPRLRARGETNFDLSKLKDTPFAAKPVKVAPSAQELERVAALKDEDFDRETYRDRDDPRVLSRKGFDKTPPMAHVLALDLRRLKFINDTYGKAKGNEVMKAFVDTVLALGGENIYFAHLSGDEYAAKSNNAAELKVFALRLEAALLSVKVPVTISGQSRSVSPGFRSGIGERTYGAADQALNAAKREEAARASARDDDVRAARGVHGAEPGSRSDIRRDAMAGAGPEGTVRSEDGSADSSAGEEVRRGEVEDTSFDFGANADEAGPRVSKSEHSPEAMSDARALVAKMRAPRRIAIATAYLDFIDGYESGAERPVIEATDVEGLAIRREFELDFLREFGIADPEVGPERTLTPESTRGRARSKQSEVDWETEDGRRNRMRMLGFSEADIDNMPSIRRNSRLFQESVDEDEKNLLVQHNLSIANLEHAIKMGGLAAPSLAITKKDAPLDNFGEVTLIGDSRLADPATTPVYDADVYSPRYPDVKHHVSNKALSSVVAKLAPYAKQLGSYLGDLDQVIEDRGPEKASGERRIRGPLEAAWLATKGIKVEPPMQPARLDFELSAEPALRLFFAAEGENNQFQPGDEYETKLKAAIVAAAAEYETKLIAADPADPAFARDVAQALTDKWIDKEDGSLRMSSLYRLFKDAKKVGTQEVDTTELEKQLEAKVDQEGRLDFERWAAAQLRGAVTKETVNSGSSGTGRQLPHTLENVLKRLTRKIRGGEEFNYGLGSARANGAKRFKNLDEVKAARNRIIEGGEFQKQKDAINERFGALAEEVAVASPRGGFGQMGDLANAIGESYNPGRSLKAALAARDIVVPAPLLAKLQDLAADLIAMPTEYFEAKPQRIVKLSEFTGAIVPQATPEEVVKQLEAQGLRVAKYKKGEKTRATAIAKLAQKKRVLFQGPDEAPASKAGFHSPNAFGKPGTPEYAVVEDMLEELGALPAQELTDEKIQDAFSAYAAWGLPGHTKYMDAIRENEAKHADASQSEANRAAGPSTERFEPVEGTDQTQGVEDLNWPMEPDRGQSGDERGKAWWGQVTKAVRLAVEKGDRTLLYSLDPEDPGAIPRGYTELPEGPMKKAFRIMLNKSADESTVIHELAHVFFEILETEGSKPDAPARVKKHLADARAALGAAEGEAFTVEQKETFARGYEAYNREGKAPKKGLEKIFARFRTWLTGIYKTAASLNVELSPELRSVFDRLLATDKEIAAALQTHGPPMVATAKEAGMTDEEWLDHQLAEQELVAEDTQDAQLAVLKDAYRERQKEWKDWRSEQVRLAKAAYEELPARRAQRLIEGRLPDGTRGEPLVLLRSSLDSAMLGKLRSRGVKTSLDPEVATNPDEIAFFSGFPTGQAMLEALSTLKTPEAWVEAEADAKMAELHPGELDDRTRLRALIENGLTKYTTDRILREDRDLRRKLPNDPSVAPVESVQRAAEMIVASRPISNLNANRAKQAERAAAQAKAVAFRKGDWAKARELGRQQLLNAFLYGEYLKARAERDSFNATLSRLNKTPAQAKLGKASAEYQDAVNAILESMGVREPGDEASRLPDDFGEWAAAANAARAKGPEALTVADMRVLSDALEYLETAARDANTAIVDRKRYDKETAIEELVAEGIANKKPVGELAASEGSEGLKHLLRELPSNLTGILLKPEIMVAWLGGELQGRDYLKSTWYRAVMQPFQDAKVRASDMVKTAIEPIAKAFDAMPKGVRERLGDAIDGAKLFPEHRVRSGQKVETPNTRFHLIMMALNMGNDSNAHRLLLGRNISPAQMVEALKLLTSEEIAFVNSVWAANEALKPLAFDLEFRLTGIRPQGFERAPIALPNGLLTGGYVPAVYDRRIEQAGELQASNVEDLINEKRYGVAATAKSHLKARAEQFSGAIQLDPDIMMTHIHQVVHDLAFREAVRSVAGLVFDGRVEAMMKDRLGQERTTNVQQWVKDVAVARALEGAASAKAITRWVRTVKGNTIYNALAFSVPNFLEDFSNIPAALAGTDLKARYLSRGLYEMAANPVKTWSEIEQRSPTMRAANDSRVRDITRKLKSLKDRGLRRVPYVRETMQWLEEHAFDLMEWSFKLTATPVWLGRYRQALEAGESEEFATTAADATIRRVFPSHNAVDASGLSRDKGFLGALLMFDGFMSSARNIYLNEAQKLFESEGARAKATAAGKLAAYTLVVTAFSAFLRGRGPDEDEEPVDWLARKTLTGVVEVNLPGSADLVKATEAKLLGKHYTPREGLMGGFLANLGFAVWTMLDDDKEPEKKAEAVIRALGPFTKFPVSQPLRTGKGLAADEVTPSGLIYGPPRQ